MADFPGGADEVIRVRWISEYVDESKGLVASQTRAREAFDRAAKDQVRNNKLTIQSAKEAALAERKRQDEQKKRVAELRDLALKESQIEKSRVKAARDASAASEKLHKAEADRQRRTTDVIRAETAKRISEYKKEQSAERDRGTERLREMQRQRKADADATQQGILRRRTEISTQGTSADRKKELRQQIAEEKQNLKDRQILSDAAIALERKKTAALQREITRRGEVEKKSIVRGTRAELKPQLTQAFESDVADLRKVLSDRESVLSDLTNQQRRLGELRGEFNPKVEGIARSGGLRPAQTTIDRNNMRGFLEANRDVRNVDRAMRNLEGSIQKVKSEMSSAGRVSESTFQRLGRSSSQARNIGIDFEKAFKDAGLAVRGFGGEKSREIRLLKTNDEMLGRNTSSMGRFHKTINQMKSGLRLSTNELILFTRTMRMLAVPAVATAISVLVQAVTNLASGAFAAVSSLAPLVNQMAVIAPLAFGAAQAFTVWKIALTNLGSSAMSVGKILSTSLMSNTDQFVNMLKTLPTQAQQFAIAVRSQLFPAFDKLRNELQAKLFPAFFDTIKFASPGLSGFGKVLGGTAGAISNLMRSVGARIGSPLFGKDLAEQGSRTNTLINRMTPAVLHLMDAFRNLSIAAKPLTDHLAKMVLGFTKWVAVQTGVSRLTGGLTRWFRESNQVMDTTISLLGHLGQAFINLGAISRRVVGNQMLKDLRGQAVAFDEWTKRGKNVQMITNYFKDMKAPLYELGGLFKDLVKSFFLISNNRDFLQLIVKMRTEMLPALVHMLTAVNKTFAPALINLLTSVIKTIAALGEAGGLTNLVKALQGLSDVVREIAASPFSKVVFGLLGLVSIIRTLRFASAISGVTFLTRNVMGLRQALNLSVFSASSLNEALAARGLVRYRPPSVLGADRIGGGPIGRSLATSAGGVVLPPGAASAAEREMTMRQQMSMRQRVIANSDIIGGVAGAGLAVGGSLMGGRAGSIMSFAGMGAMVGAPFGGLGAPIGAAVGALAGFAISVNNARSGIEKLGDAAEKTAEKTGTARERTAAAVQDLRGALLGRQEAAANLKTQQGQLRHLQRTPGMQGAVEQQMFAVQDALQVYRDSRHRVSEDKRIIVSSMPTLLAGRKEFASQLLGALGMSQSRMKAVLGRGSTADIGTKVQVKDTLGDWNKFLDGLTESKDKRIAQIAQHLKDISKTKLPSKHEVQVELKLFGPPEVWKWLQGHMKQVYSGQISPQQIPTKKAIGGRIPGAAVAADTVPALLSPGEFVVTGDGERMLDSMTGIPGVLNYVGANQRPHFATGGRVGAYDYGSAGLSALQSGIGGSTYQSIVSSAISTATSALGGLSSAASAASKADFPATTPSWLKKLLVRMMSEARGWAGKGVMGAPGVGLGINGRFLSTNDYGLSSVNSKRGLDPGAVISDIIRAGYPGFPDVNPNVLSQVLEYGKSKYFSVLLRPGAPQEFPGGYDAAVRIGNRGFGFSGGKFTTRDLGGSGSGGGGLSWLQYSVKGWPKRKGGRIQRMMTGGRAGGVNPPGTGSSFNQRIFGPSTVGSGTYFAIPSLPPPPSGTGTGSPASAAAANPYGAVSQARLAQALVGFANSVIGGATSYLGSLAQGFNAQLVSLGNQLLAAQASGKTGVANRITAQIAKIQAQLEITEGQIGVRIYAMASQIQKLADTITAITDKVQNTVARLGLDPAGSTALKMTQKVLTQSVVLDKKQIGIAQKQLATLRSAGASQDMIDQQAQAVAAAQQQYDQAVTAVILGRRGIRARKFERGETRSAFGEQLAELGLQGLQTRQSIAGTYDAGGGERAGFILSNIVPAIRKQIAATEATLKHAKELKLTEDQKNDELIKLATLRNQLAEQQLAAQQEGNSMLSKTLGKLTFEFNSQSWSDMIGSGVGI